MPISNPQGRNHPKMDTCSDANGVKRRKLRKGTHSCWECRRRKVKCTFTSPADEVCITCHRRGTKCATQEALDESDTIERGTIHSVKLPPAPVPNSLPKVESNSLSNVHQFLLRSLPPQKDIEILLDKITHISILSYRSSYRAHNSASIGDLLSVPNLLQHEAHPILLGRQMLLFATSLQYLSPNEVISGLTKHHHIITEELAESAIRMITTNEALYGTLEGLENIILEGFYHIDRGNIRRAWVTLRRAVIVAQLLNLHRPNHYHFKCINNQNDLDPEAMWNCIVSMECFLSLLLALPTSTASTMDRESMSMTQKTASLPVLIMNLTAKILERNQLQKVKQALDMTREIDHEAIKIAEQLPSTLWQPSIFTGLQVGSAEALLEVRRTWDHMCYYTLVNQLHLPYMLCPSQSKQTMYSRLACVNASREVLGREIAIRLFNPVTPCRRMGDFMALIAGMTLMLAHIISHCHADGDNLLRHQRLSDRATVDRALECMRSELREDVLAARCAALLDNLLAVEADAAVHDYRAQSVRETENDHEDGHSVLVIVVPYLGTIRIAREGITSMPFGGFPESITIGGIGSLRVNSTKATDHIRNNTSDFLAHAPNTQVSDEPTNQNATFVPQRSLSEDLLVQQDQMFPDVAANMEDWVFQGFDTAFFDVIMRGTDSSVEQ